MKEATGELNITVITVVAIAAIAALFYAFVWPMIKQQLANKTCDAMGANWQYSTSKTNDKCVESASDDAGGKTYYCCPPSATE